MWKLFRVTLRTLWKQKRGKKTLITNYTYYEQNWNVHPLVGCAPSQLLRSIFDYMVWPSLERNESGTDYDKHNLNNRLQLSSDYMYTISLWNLWWRVHRALVSSLQPTRRMTVVNMELRKWAGTRKENSPVVFTSILKSRCSISSFGICCEKKHDKISASGILRYLETSKLRFP